MFNDFCIPDSETYKTVPELINRLEFYDCNVQLSAINLIKLIFKNSNCNPGNMNADEFREFGRATIDFIADYLENIRDR